MTQSKNKSYEVSLKFNNKDKDDYQISILRDVLLNFGLKKENIVELHANGCVYLITYFYAPEKARALRKKLDQCKLKKVNLFVKTLNKKDWQTKWKEDFKPFPITDDCVIVPFWLRNKYSSKGKTKIFLESGLAFGTGMHATTRFMAAFLKICSGRFASFLDVGTGTGILSLLAFIYGASEITAIDMKHESISVAKANFRNNAFKYKYLRAIHLKKFKKREKYDFVAANLITHDLLLYQSKLKSLVKTNGFLAVSGVSLNNYNMFRKQFNMKGLKCYKIQKGGEWSAFLFRKSK